MAKFMAVGDLMLASHRGTGRMVHQHGPHFLFEEISPVLDQADLLFGNLESPFVFDGAVSYTNRVPHMTFGAEPISAEGLKGAGFHVLSTANNHITDYGEQGLRWTAKVLEETGIEFAGMYAPSVHPGYAVIQRRDTKVAFLGYNAPALPRAHPRSAHSWRIKKFSKRNVKRDINYLKSSVKPDIIIVSCHWGKDYTTYPIPFQMEIARGMIDEGAHIILGHGPHFIQGTERYKHGVIVYSLADFIFDEPDPLAQETFIFSCTLSPDGVSDVEYIPVVRNEVFQPLLAEGARRREILEKIASLSEEYRRADWINNPEFDHTETFFTKTIWRGLTYRNLRDAMSVYPPRFWIRHGVPILAAKGCKWALRGFRFK